MSRNPQGEPRTVAGRAFYEAGLVPDGRYWSRATTDPDEMLRAILAIEAEAAAPVEGLRMDQPWNVLSIVEKLADYADHYLSDHSCDVLGYEQVVAARDAGREWLAALRAIESPAHPETGLPVSAWGEVENALPYKRWHATISGDWENGWEAEVTSSLVAGEKSITVSTNKSGWFHEPGGHRTIGDALRALRGALAAAP